jgi:hypothetical protein
VIEVEVGQDDAVDVRVGEASPLKVVEQGMSLLLNSEAVAKLWWEECTDPRLEQNLAIAVFDQERSAGEGDTIQLVGFNPLSPEGARCVPKHRATVETL